MEQLLRRVLFCLKRKATSRNRTAVGILNPPTVLKFRISAPPLPFNAMLPVADIHLYEGGREEPLQFFMSFMTLHTNGSAVLKLSAFGQ